MHNLKIVKKIENKIYNMFKNENSGHDFSHLKRVMKNAQYIQKHKGGDAYVITISALVHDIHRLVSNQKGHFTKPEECLDEVKQILIDCNIEKEKLEQILYVVKNHESKDNKSFNLETLIVQDADTLDAIGKIGLKRCLKYCKTHNIPISNKNYPLDSKEYIPDINPISACHYIYNTMIPHGKNLYTKTAQKVAEGKVKLLENFIAKQYK